MKKIILIIVAILLSCNPADPDEETQKKYITHKMKKQEEGDIMVEIETKSEYTYYALEVFHTRDHYYTKQDSLKGNQVRFYNPFKGTKDVFVIITQRWDIKYERLIGRLYYKKILVAEDSIYEQNNRVVFLHYKWDK